jgi:hypothetical protein
MKTASVVTAPLLAISLAVVAACGGAGDSDNELERALRSVTENDLAVMVLPQEDLGEEFAALEIDDDSGFKDNEEAADETIDPDDTADSLERAGRINGYELLYSAPSLSVLEAGVGVIEVATEVDLFRDAGVASDHLAKQVEDWQRLEGEQVEAGVTLEKVETFAVKGLADEAVGLRARGTFGEVQFYETVVAVRLDRLVGAAYAYRADDANVNSQIEAIARALEERIEGVLLGDIGGVPVPVPQADEEAAAPPPPEGGPDLAAMALSLDDLPAGASIDHEGYVEDEDTFASYEREFDVGFVGIGNSRPMGVQSEIDLYENAGEASSAFATNEAFIAMGESDPEFLAFLLSEGADVPFTNVRVEPVSAPGLGDELAAAHFFLDTSLGRFETTQIFVRLDRAIGMLSLMGPAGKVDPTDAVSLAEAMAARMAAELSLENNLAVAPA